ncbi:hypothetical protein BJ170DRAFT_590782 [Xylariales sp. AK1849]|nr:hypothetical protein BJ170DRAFT_590782 [Xylariales sp. AK1849]
MTWASNPLFTSREKGGNDLEASPQKVILKGLHEGFQEPSKHFTGQQAFYLLVPHGIIAAIISGAINLVIAIGMYGTTADSVNLFKFPNTLVGDTAVTIILQCIITWLIELMLVNHDLRKGGIASIRAIGEPKCRFMRWFAFIDRGEETYTESRFAHWMRFLASQVVRAFLIAVVSFVILIGPCIGILISVGKPNGKDWEYDHALPPSIEDWKPPIFKAVLGAVLGLFTTPLFALFWMMRCGWALPKNEKHYGEI